ncbi:MAG: AraC family transcriptional regulator [Roseivirga sp.]|nr:AraC family transcriptional regulator [Roseivirga sp.]
MEASDIIDIIGISQGIILGLLIFLNRPDNSKTYTYLSLYLVSIGLTSSLSVLEDWDVFVDYPSLYFAPVNFFFLFPVLLYLYTREISGFPRERVTWKLFLPGILEFLIWSVLLVFALTGNAPDLESDAYGWFEGLYYLAALIFMITYLVKIIRFITRVKKKAEDNFSSMTHKTLSWLRIGCFLLLMTFLFPIVDEIEPGLEESTYYAETIINSVMLFWLAIHGYKQTVVLGMQTPGEQEQVEGKEKPDQGTRVIPLEGDKKRYQAIEKLIEKKELYKRQELTLSQLAEEADIHQKQLSFLINQFSGKNFFNFINEYRVREAQQLLINKDFEHLSFLGIAFEAGFNSKATFNATFKKVTGQTPRQFKTSKQSA